MELYRWTELAKRQREIRVPCPHCGSLKYLTAHDNPFHWEEERKRGWCNTQCESPKCAKFHLIKTSRDGVEVRK